MANPYIERIRAAATSAAATDPNLSYALYALAEMLAALESRISAMEVKVSRIEVPDPVFGRSPV